MLVITLLTIFITGCYTVRVFHDTDMLREKHDGEMYSISMPFTDIQIVGQAERTFAGPPICLSVKGMLMLYISPSCFSRSMSVS